MTRGQSYCLVYLLLVIFVKVHRTDATINDFHPLTTSIVTELNDVNDEPAWRSTSTLTTTRPPQQEDSQPLDDFPSTLESSETAVSRRIERASTDCKECSTFDENSAHPTDHVIPYSDHEEARDVATRPDYKAPGEWSKPPKHVPLDFVPTKLYAQVRGTRTVKRLPREEALKSAETEEERENAPRLREVVKNKKVNTVYTEEGYEDSAYDHAGHVRDADFHEGFARKLHDQANVKEKSRDGQKNEEEEIERIEDRQRKKVNVKEFEDYDEDYRDHYDGKIEDTGGSGKIVDGGRNGWIEPSIHPKTFAVNEIQRLQDDVEKEVEEIEENVEINKIERKQDLEEEDYDDGASESRRSYDRQSRNGQRRRVESNEDVPRAMARVSERTERTDAPSVDSNRRRTKPQRKSRRRENTSRRIVETTEVPENDGTSRNVSTVSTRKLNRNSYTSSPYSVSTSTEEETTTVSYSELFWNFFKTQQNQSTTAPSTNTATTNYVSSKEEVSTVSSLIDSSETFTSQKVSTTPFEELISTNRPSNGRRSQRNDKNDYAQDINNLAIRSTVSTRVSLAPILEPESTQNLWLQPLTTEWTPVTEDFSPSKLSKVELATFVPTASVTEFQESVNAEKSQLPRVPASNDYENNPFVSQQLRNSHGAAIRKPRYKVLARYKPSVSKHVESVPTRKDKGSILSNAATKTIPGQVTPVQNTELDEKYIKVLSYIRNEKTDPRRTEEQKDHVWKNDETNVEDLTVMRPPPPRKIEEITYFDYYPAYSNEKSTLTSQSVNENQDVHRGSWRRPVLREESLERPTLTSQSVNENQDVLRGNWKRPVLREESLERPTLTSQSVNENQDVLRGSWKRPVQREESYARPNGLFNPLNNLDRFTGDRPSYRRNFIPETRLVPPSPLVDSEYAKYQIDSYPRNDDRLSYDPNGQRSNRNPPSYGYFPRTREVLGKSAVRRRKRRSTRKLESSSGTFDFVKAENFWANNGTSNRGAIESSGKNSHARRTAKIGRNSLQPRVRRGTEFVSDMSSPAAKHGGKKKSRFYGNAREHEEVSLDLLHKHGDVIADGESSIPFNGNKSKSGNVSVEETIDSAGNERGSPGRIETVVDESAIRQKTDETIVDNSTKARRDKRVVDSRELPGRRWKRKSHEELLDEAPKITNDVIDKEINDRFNDEEEDEEEEEKDKEKENEKEDRKVEIEIPDFDYVEELVEEEPEKVTTTTEAPLDLQKYPFYKNDKIPIASALKYAIDPRKIPRKTKGGMEFYESRDAYKHCDEVEPDLDEVVPEKEEPEDRGPKEDLPRLRGLGDKLNCFKAKYFGENPFDNPLFTEKAVEEPALPTELNPKYFSSRIMVFPKENDEYVVQKPSKKPEHNHARSRRPGLSDRGRAYGTQESIRLDYKHDPRTGRGRNAYFHSVRSNVPRNSKGSRGTKPQESERRPSYGTRNLSTKYPARSYQNQVYEDVMGNIRHLANTYKVREDPDSENSEESGEKKDAHGLPSTLKRQKLRKKDVRLKDVTENSSKSKTNVDGSTSNYSSRHPTIYRGSRASHKSRAGSYKPPARDRIVGHYRKIQIHKRSVTSEDDASKVWKENVREVGSMERNETTMEESTVVVPRFNSTHGNYTVDLVSDETKVKRSSTAVSRADVPRKRSGSVRNSSSTNLSSVEEEEKEKGGRKVVYTIRDRIRHSKPKEDTPRVGQFTTNETTPEEDHRRKEPKYNHVKRRKPQDSTVSTSTTASLTTSTEKVIEEVETSAEKPKTDRKVTKSQRYRYDSDGGENKRGNSQERFENYPKKNITEFLAEKNPAVSVEETTKGYEVHENIQERVSTTEKSSSPDPAEVSKLKAYLDTEPPGYTEAFSEKYEKRPSTHEESNSNESNVSREDKTSLEDDKKKEDYETDKSYHPPYFSDENSSEKTGSSYSMSKSDSRQEHEPSSSNKKPKGKGTFFAYDSRPLSPAENFEDEKYSDLGPRINKPRFYHPPFPISMYKASRDSENRSDPSDERDSTERKEGKTVDGRIGKQNFVFPWYRDKEDDETKESRYRETGRYEFPWERRERLAREERKRTKGEQERSREMGSREEEEDVAPSTSRRRRTYYSSRSDRPKSRKNDGRDIWSDSYMDNDESSSEHKPVMKYSSRFNSKTVKLPFIEKQQGASPISVEEISKSIKKILEDNSENSSKSSGENVDSSYEKKVESNSESNRGISRGSIVPENITLSPRKKSERKKNSRVTDVTTEASNSRRVSRKERNEGRDEKTSTLEKTNAERSEPRVDTSSNNPKTVTQEVESKRSNPKRKRKSSKNTNVTEASTESAGKNPRKQRFSTSTPATAVVTPSGTTSTTSRTARRKPQKVDESRANVFPTVAPNKSRNRVDARTETSTRGRDVDRSRGQKEKASNRNGDAWTERREASRGSKSRGQPEKKQTNRKNILKLEREEERGIKSKEDEPENEQPSTEVEKYNRKKVYYSIERKDGLGDESPSRSLELKDEEEKKLNDYASLNDTPEDGDDGGGESFGGILNSESHVAGNLLQSVPVRPAKSSRRAKKSEHGEKSTKYAASNEVESKNAGRLKKETARKGKANGEVEDEGKGVDVPRRVIKDPSQRLYYYVERRK